MKSFEVNAVISDPHFLPFPFTPFSPREIVTYRISSTCYETAESGSMYLSIFIKLKDVQKKPH